MPQPVDLEHRNGSRVTVTEAVERRSSTRAFLPTPVSRELVVQLLERAARAPSGGNVQPWQIDVLAGRSLAALRALVADRMAAGAEETPEYDIYPEKLWEPHRIYRYATGEAMYELAGIDRADQAARRRHLEANYRLFGAPVGLFFSIDRRMGRPQWSDLGMLMQTIMLLAVEQGLATCAQECWSRWPESVAHCIGLNKDRMLFAGMALGYADPDAPINQLRTTRAAIDHFVTFRGFDHEGV